jgi:OmcA/MtrC family decaheme c-type cytochrome
MTMQRRQRTHGLLGTAAAAVLLAMTLGLAGCGSDGDDGADGRDGQDGQDGRDAITVTDAAFGVDSPNASLCYSCHQHVDESGLIRAHINALGGEMYGFGTHIDEGAEGCSTCHGGMRVGTDRSTGLPYPTGLSPELHAGGQHRASRPSLNDASITDVSISGGEVEISFVINGYEETSVNAEFTIAKWVEEEGSWISMLQRSVGGGEDALVIRAGNLRFEDNDAGPVTRIGPADPFVFTFASDNDEPNRWPVAAGVPLNFEQGAVWRDPADLDPSSYCIDAGCETFVGSVIAKTVADASWDPNGTYRIGVTGRNREAQTGIPYARFAAVADVTLAGGVFAGPPATPLPNNQIAQGSCNTCHEARLVFPRNDVHGQQRPAIAVCSNCHNNYTYDADASTATAGGWVNISLGTMAHKIHSGIAGYTIDGYEYENVAYPDWTLTDGTPPGNTASCTSCHNATEDGFGGGWDRQDPPVATACANCHTAGGYDVQLGPHAPGNSGILGNCASCHGDLAIQGLGYKQTPDTYHGVTARLEALQAQREDYQFSLVNVSDAVYEGTPVVQWQVLDGGGVPYNLSSDISIDGGPRLHIGWGFGDDWTNEGSGEKSARPPRENDDGGRPVALNVATTGDSANTVLSADGLTAITTFPRFTDAEAGKGNGFANLEEADEGRRGFVAIHRNVSDNGTTRLLTSVVQPIILGSGEVELAELRRNTVDATFGLDAADKRGSGCLDCHGTITAHGSGYTADNNVQACITCHNAGSHRSIAGAALEGEEPYSVDFMYLMHKVHSSPDTLYPQVAQQRCHACHAGEGDGSDGNVDGFLNQTSNCSLCHNGVINAGRLGVISDWPGAIGRYGLRGDGTNGQ